ncbi:MAG TPA: CHAT domain-containing protein [Pyrinomonadaceae bacterium]
MGRHRPNCFHKQGTAVQTIFFIFVVVSFSDVLFTPLTRTRVIAQNQSVALLQPEDPKTLEISPGEVKVFKVSLKQGQCLRLSLDKEDLRLSVAIQNPDGQTIGTFPGRRHGSLKILHVANRTGDYVIQIQSLEKSTPNLSFRLTLQQPADASAADRTEEAALRLINDAELLRSQWEEQALRQAITKYTEASHIWETQKRYEEAAQALSKVGDIYSVLSDYEMSLQAYEKGLKLQQKAGDNDGEIDSFNEIGYAYSYLGNNERALEFLNRALQYSDSHAGADKNPRRLAQTLNNIGEVYYAKSDLPESFKHFNRGLDLWTKTGDRAGQALAYLNLGYSYYDSGELQQAGSNYQKSLSLSQAIDDQRGEALARTALGGVYSITGEKQLALDAHTDAMKTLRRLGDHLGEAAALNGVGGAYEELNQDRLALDNYIDARELYGKAGKTDYEAISNYYIGRVYRSLGDIPAALEAYNHCIELSLKAGNHRFETDALKEIAIVYNLKGDRTKALELFEKVLQFYQSAVDKRGEAYALGGIGYTRLLLNQPLEASKFFESALSLSREIKDRSAEVSFLYYAAIAARDQNNADKALEYIRQSIQLIESMRTKVISRDLRVSYFASVHDNYEFYVDLLMQLDQRQPNQGYAAMAFEISEQGKARSLLDSLTAARVDFPGQSDPQLVSRLKELRESLNAKAEYQMRLMNGAHTPEMAAQTDKEIRELRAAYNQTESQLRAQSPRYADLVSAQFVKLKDVQSELRDENTRLVEFSLGTEKSYAWVVSSSSIKGYELPKRAVLEETILRVNEFLTARQPVNGESVSEYQRRVEVAETQYWPEAASLSRQLLGPMKAELEGHRLLIVPDGALEYVPFEALPFPQDNAISNQTDESTTPLVVQQEVVKLPSAAVLTAVRREETRASRTIVILADPVFSTDDERMPAPVRTASRQNARYNPPTQNNLLRDSVYIGRLAATQREGEEIMRLLPKTEAKLVSGFDANHTFVSSPELSQYRVIHLATHGIINAEHPELSAVILSLVDRDGRSEDGFLRLHEIYNLSLHADLVVLSACQTGLGKDFKGEGLVGLTRGFMYAGSKSVVATLWKVDDEATTELMKHFYEGLFREQMTPAAALRQAKIAIWKERRWRSPFFWAAFELHGEYAKPINVDGSRFQKYLVIFFLILLCSIAIYYGSKYFRRLHE